MPTAQETFAAKHRQCERLIEELAKAIHAQAIAGACSPDWGYAGSLGKAAHDLAEIVAFLRGDADKTEQVLDESVKATGTMFEE